MTDVKDMTLRICHVYPSLLSVAGDRGNLFSIQRRCDWRGIKTEVREVEVGEMVDFSQYDLMFLKFFCYDLIRTDHMISFVDWDGECTLHTLDNIFQSQGK